MKFQSFATFLLLLLFHAALPCPAPAQSIPPPPPALIYYAGMPGRLTMERDDTGGNPFATALVEILRDPNLRLGDFGGRLAAATQKHAHGWQSPEVPRRVPTPQWIFASGPDQRRIALVVAVTDYSKSDLASLAGSLFDAGRVSAALTRAGFDTRTVMNVSREPLEQELSAFGDASESADAALVYVTGHGVQHRREAFLVLGDYPSRSAEHLATHAVPIGRFSAAARATAVNLVLFAGCRDAPFQQSATEAP